MYARKLLSTRLIRYEFDAFINISYYYSPQSHDCLIPTYQQVRPYSLSNVLLTRSGNNSFTIRDIGQNSR
ncbi:unnamed protein product, partial [Adineta steineri]